MRNYLKSTLITFILAMTLFSCTSSIIYSSISIIEFKKVYRQNKKIHIIDVRSLIEFYGPLGHIKNAAHRPVAEINKTILDLKNALNTPIYVICRTGNRSREVTEILTENGIFAINVEGGMKAWNK